ncbi:hypothetical protein Pfo_024552 [Paulownia fortunei]|nr:hypothetical protein Pfo_024552 [Paulownia fortunei]
MPQPNTNPPPAPKPPDPPVKPSFVVVLCSSSMTEHPSVDNNCITKMILTDFEDIKKEKQVLADVPIRLAAAQNLTQWVEKSRPLPEVNKGEGSTINLANNTNLVAGFDPIVSEIIEKEERFRSILINDGFVQTLFNDVDVGNSSKAMFVNCDSAAGHLNSRVPDFNSSYFNECIHDAYAEVHCSLNIANELIENRRDHPDKFLAMVVHHDELLLDAREEAGHSRSKSWSGQGAKIEVYHNYAAPPNNKNKKKQAISQIQTRWMLRSSSDCLSQISQ